MKKVCLVLFFCLVSFCLFGKTEVYSITGIKKGEIIHLYDTYTKKRKIIAGLSAASGAVISTHKLIEYQGEFWLKVRYKEKSGWMNRKNLAFNTNGIFDQNLEQILIDLTSSLQKDKMDNFKVHVNSLKSIYLFSKNDSLFFYSDYKNIESMWGDQRIQGFFNELQYFLEHYFDVIYVPGNTAESNGMTELISRYDSLLLTNKAGKILQIGIEYWNETPAVTYLAFP